MPPEKVPWIALIRFVLSPWMTALVAIGLASASLRAAAGPTGLVPARSTWRSLTSERAHISDPRVRTLADQVSSSHRKEIDEMIALVQELKSTGERQSAHTS